MNCEECTLCCTMFPVNWLNKEMNTDCKHCNLGCMIHDTKPSECSDYNCMYAQVENVPKALRPDISGIIFDKMTDKIIYGMLDPKKNPSEIGKKQIGAFISQGFSVIMASSKKTENRYLINPAHDENEIRKEFTQCITNRYGRIRN